MEINDEIKQACILAQSSDPKEFEANLTAILNWRCRIAPSYIDELEDNEIFVFGSDEKGNHKGGAAKFALNNGWAEYCQSNGIPQDTPEAEVKSYAITTTDLYEEETWEPGQNLTPKKNNQPQDLTKLEKYIQVFIDYAEAHPDKKFLVTAIGTGAAGFSTQDVAEKFIGAVKLKNVHLPMAFWMEIFGDTFPEGKTPSDVVPCQSKPVNDYQQELSRQLALYCQWLRRSVDQTQAIQYRKLIMTVERNCTGILNAVDRMYRGLPAVAYDELKGCFEPKKEKEGTQSDQNDYIDWKLKFTPEGEKHKYYRLRVETDNWKKREVDAYGMFHLPYNLRNLATTQRYSVPGYPSLYMGQHVFSCWEERGRPNLSNCLISRLTNQNEFYILDLTIPNPSSWRPAKSNRWDPTNEQFQYQAIFFPFIIASTFKTTSTTDNFKPEYIIPQLLFQYVKNYAFEQNRQNKTVKVYGIKYTSVHFPGYISKSNGSSVDREQYDNYVVPVLNIKNLYCKHLCSLFHITAPFCEDYSPVRQTTAEQETTIFQKIEKELEMYPLETIFSEGPKASKQIK